MYKKIIHRMADSIWIFMVHVEYLRSVFQLAFRHGLFLKTSQFYCLIWNARQFYAELRAYTYFALIQLNDHCCFERFLQKRQWKRFFGYLVEIGQ